MQIEKIVLLNKKNKYSIFITDGSNFDIIEDTLVKFNLYKGMEIESELIEKIKIENDKLEAAQSVYRFLLNKKTEKEVNIYLKNKGYNDVLIESTIQYLKEKNFIDDEKYAQLFINDKLKINMYGRNKIKMALLLKGIDKTIIDKYIRGIDSDIEMQNLLKQAKKKYLSIKDSKNSTQKLYNYLINKGYSYDMIKTVLSLIIDEENYE